MQEILSNLSTQMLKEVITGSFNSTKDGSEIVVSSGLDELQSRLNEDEFVSFCETL